jgi:hypothetical protein
MYVLYAGTKAVATRGEDVVVGEVEVEEEAMVEGVTVEEAAVTIKTDAGVLLLTTTAEEAGVAIQGQGLAATLRVSYRLHGMRYHYSLS